MNGRADNSALTAEKDSVQFAEFPLGIPKILQIDCAPEFNLYFKGLVERLFKELQNGEPSGSPTRQLCIKKQTRTSERTAGLKIAAGENLKAPLRQGEEKILDRPISRQRPTKRKVSEAARASGN